MRWTLISLVLGLGIAAPIGAIAQGTGTAPRVSGSATQPYTEGAFPSLAGATSWINSPALTPAGLQGKVVLVDFWTYTCINWLRTLPYVRAWAEKYKDQGLVVIGVHTPEFEFETNVANVRLAAVDMKVPYPIAVDSDGAVWRAFSNQYWPALYLIDAQGRIRHHQFGEGNYEQTERVLQKLLTESGAMNVPQDLVAVAGHGAEAPADWANLKSQENYLGYERTAHFASPGGAGSGTPREYAVPSRLKLNSWALSGNWTMGDRATVLNKPNGRVAYQFHARDVHLVMGPVTPAAPVRFRILIDGKPPGAAHGEDVDADGLGTVKAQRMYQLIRQPKPITDRRFEIEFLDPSVEVFAFTFG